MKLAQIATSLIFFSTSAAFAAGDHAHAHEHQALHGGVVVEVKDMDYELVATPETIQLHVRDHGKSVDVSKSNAKLTILVGTDKQIVELKPAGQQLEAAGSFKFANSKIVALVSVPGKAPATVRFVLK